MVAHRDIGKTLIALCCLTTAQIAWADVNAGVDAWTNGNFTAAVAEWKEPAAKGDPDAQFNLGQAYKLGRGVKQDLAIAEALFGKAAAQGHMQASDNYGFLLFQRGEQSKAIPYITAAMERGDPRAQYLLGVAYFNGDHVPKDWVRAYALVSLAQQAGLPMAQNALSQMDLNVSLEQRQQSIALAQEIAVQADNTRARQMATATLGSAPSEPGSLTIAASPTHKQTVAPSSVPDMPFGSNPADAGADYARPDNLPHPSTQVAAAPNVAKPAAVKTRQTPAGNWRIQIGAFGVATNADAMWERVKSRPEVSGYGKVLIPAGKITRLLIGGYASQAAAQSACTRLSAAGISCIVQGN